MGLEEGLFGPGKSVSAGERWREASNLSDTSPG